MLLDQKSRSLKVKSLSEKKFKAQKSANVIRNITLTQVPYYCRLSFLIGFGHFHGSTQLYVSIAKFRIPFNKACQSIITTIVHELSLYLPRKRTPTGSWPSVSSSCLSKDSMPCATEKDRWGVPLIEKHYYFLISDMTPWNEVLCRKSSRILS